MSVVSDFHLKLNVNIVIPAYIPCRVSDNRIQSIFHIADLHIPNDNGEIDSRIPEYTGAFNNCIDNFKGVARGCRPSDILIFIAGDIFHQAKKDKGCISAAALHVFKSFLKRLQNIGTVVIISGNHDNNITYKSNGTKTPDVISSILKDINGLGESIFYLKDTGRYLIDNCMFYTVSVFDLDKNTGLVQYPRRLELLPTKLDIDKVDHHIMGLHCGVQGQLLQNGHMLKGYAYAIRDIENFDIVLLGDTHNHQFLGTKNNIAYPSSLIQQNHGESVYNHGYIKWELEGEQQYSGTFHDIHNEYCFINLDLINVASAILLEGLDEYSDKKNMKIRIEYSQETPLEVLESLKDDIRRRFPEKKLTFSNKRRFKSYENKNSIIESIDNHEKFQKYLDEEGFSIEVQDYIKNEVKSLFDKISNGSSSWTPIELTLANFLTTSGLQTISFVDIPVGSVISIAGLCAVGKTNIQRALAYVIWGKKAIPGVVKLEGMINLEGNDMRVTFKFMSGGRTHVITRGAKRKKQISESLKYVIDDAVAGFTGKEASQVEIEKIFNKFEDAKMTWILQQDLGEVKIEPVVFDRNIGIGGWDERRREEGKRKKAIEKRLKVCRMFINKCEDVVANIPKLRKDDSNIDVEISRLRDLKEDEIRKESFGTKWDRIGWESEKTNLEKELEEKMLKKPSKISEDEYRGILKESAATEASLANNNRKKEELKRLRCELDTLEAPKYDKDKLEKKYENIESEISGLRDQSVRNKTIVESLNFNDEEYNEWKKTKTRLDAEIKSLVGKIERLSVKVDIKVGELVHLDESGEVINEKLELLNTNKDNLKKIIDDIRFTSGKIKQYEKHLENFKECSCATTGNKWINVSGPDDCECCKENKSKYDIDTDSKELSKCSDELEALRTKSVSVRKDIDALEIYIGIKEHLETNNNINQEIKQIKNKITNYKLQLENKHGELDRVGEQVLSLDKNKQKKDSANIELQKITKELNKLRTSEEKVSNKLRLLEKYKKKEDALHNKIVHHKKDILTLIVERREVEKYTKYEEQKRDYDLGVTIENLDKEINERRDKIEKCGDYDAGKVTSLTSKLEQLQEGRDNIKHDLTIAIKTNIEYNEKVAEEEKLNVECSNKGDLINVLDRWPTQLRTSALIKMESEVNAFIKWCGFDFETKFEWVQRRCRGGFSAACDISYINKKGQPLALISGGEKFAFRLAVMHGLADITNLNKSPILFIDEGFGGWDTKHLDSNLKEIFGFLKSHYHYTLSISHIQCVQQCGDILWTITKSGGIVVGAT